MDKEIFSGLNSFMDGGVRLYKVVKESSHSFWGGYSPAVYDSKRVFKWEDLVEATNNGWYIDNPTGLAIGIAQSCYIALTKLEEQCSCQWTRL